MSNRAWDSCSTQCNAGYLLMLMLGKHLRWKATCTALWGRVGHKFEMGCTVVLPSIDPTTTVTSSTTHRQSLWGKKQSLAAWKKRCCCSSGQLVTTAAGEADHRRIPLSLAHEPVCIHPLDAAAKVCVWKAALVAFLSKAGVTATTSPMAEMFTTTVPEATSCFDLESRCDVASFGS